MVACYTLIIPSALMPYWRAERIDGRLRTVSPGLDRLAGLELPAAADLLLAIEAQANAVSFYWQEEASEDVLDEIKALLRALAAKN